MDGWTDGWMERWNGVSILIHSLFILIHYLFIYSGRGALQDGLKPVCGGKPWPRVTLCIRSALLQVFSLTTGVASPGFPRVSGPCLALIAGRAPEVHSSYLSKSDFFFLFRWHSTLRVCVSLLSFTVYNFSPQKDHISSIHCFFFPVMVNIRHQTWLIAIFFMMYAGLCVLNHV